MCTNLVVSRHGGICIYQLVFIASVGGIGAIAIVIIHGEFQGSGTRDIGLGLGHTLMQSLHLPIGCSKTSDPLAVGCGASLFWKALPGELVQAIVNPPSVKCGVPRITIDLRIVVYHWYHLFHNSSVLGLVTITSSPRSTGPLGEPRWFDTEGSIELVDSIDGLCRVGSNTGPVKDSGIARPGCTVPWLVVQMHAGVIKSTGSIEKIRAVSEPFIVPTETLGVTNDTGGHNF